MRKGKIVAWALVTALTLPAARVSGLPANSAAGYSDIAGHWAEDIIQSFSAKGAVSGYPDGSFKPDAQMTRAEAVAMLNGNFNISGPYAPEFADVKPGDWYYGVIGAAQHKGYIADSINGGQFYPNTMCSRLDAMVMAYNLLGAPAAGDTGILERYEDYSTIPTTRPVYRQAVAYFLAKGVISGYPDGTLRVSTGVTRAEMLSLMNKVNDLIDKTTEQTQTTPSPTPASVASEPAIATATANVDRDNWPAPKPPGNDYSHIGGGNGPQGTPEPTETDNPSEEPEPTETIAPTEEPEPTETIAPTEEPQPTEPEAPTEEPQPTEPEAPTEEPQPTEPETPGLPDGVPDGATLIEPGTDLDDALKNNAPGNYYITSDFAVAQDISFTIKTGVNLYVAAGATLTAGKDVTTLIIPADTTLAVVTGGTVTTINNGRILIHGTFTIDGGEVTDPADGSSGLTIYVENGCTFNNDMGDALLDNMGTMWVYAGGLVNWGVAGDATYHFIGSKPLNPVRQNNHARSDETNGQYVFALTSGEIGIFQSSNGKRFWNIAQVDPNAIVYLNQPYTLQANDDMYIGTSCVLHLQAPLTWLYGVGTLDGNGTIIDENGHNYDPNEYPQSQRQRGTDQTRTYYFDTVTGKWREIK